MVRNVLRQMTRDPNILVKTFKDTLIKCFSPQTTREFCLHNSEIKMDGRPTSIALNMPSMEHLRYTWLAYQLTYIPSKGLKNQPIILIFSSQS